MQHKDKRKQTFRKNWCKPTDKEIVCLLNWWQIKEKKNSRGKNIEVWCCVCIHSFRYIFSFRSSSIHVDKYYIEKQHFHTRTRIITLKIFSRNAIQSVGMQFYTIYVTQLLKESPLFWKSVLVVPFLFYMHTCYAHFFSSNTACINMCVYI